MYITKSLLQHFNKVQHYPQYCQKGDKHIYIPKTILYWGNSCKIVVAIFKSKTGFPTVKIMHCDTHVIQDLFLISSFWLEQNIKFDSNKCVNGLCV